MAASAAETAGNYPEDISKSKIWQVIGASSVGTMIEWYDFYIGSTLLKETRGHRIWEEVEAETPRE